MRVLVTGGNGLLGRELCRALSEEHQVFGLIHSPIELPVSNVHYLQIDLSKKIDYSLLPEQIDVVFHLAQSSKFRDFPNGARDTFLVNTSSTLDLLEYCRVAKVQKFFLASTGGVYGDHIGPITEAGMLVPPSDIGFYFASKLSAELLSSTYREELSVTILRLFFMYGPRQKPDMFLPRLINCILKGEEITINRSGGIRVNPVFVNDVAHILASLIDRDLPSVINIGGPDVVSIQEIANHVGQIVSKVPIFVERNNSTSDVVADITTMKGLTSGIELTPITTGIEFLIKSMIRKE
jgi:UDP-glucose 4-epimerase